MGIKKLKPVTPSFDIPEGFQFLPVPLILYSKSTGELWANESFDTEFERSTLETFKIKKPIGLIQERPVSTLAFTSIGRHEGFVVETKAGKKIPVDLKVSQFGDQTRDTFLILFENVSLRVELQQQLIQHHLELQKAYEKEKTTQTALVQAAKLASLGELSSGIAHELNQPLQAIMGFSQELQYVETLSETGKEFLNDIINASRKMAEIIKSLRTFAREAGSEIGEVSVEHALSEAVRLMRHTLLQGGVEIEMNLEKNLPPILANPIQLEQVIVNLLSNAKDAIESKASGGGKIRLIAEKFGKELIIKVQDNGGGMSPEVQQKIFDPFFTTKEVGKGTGLGLSITYGILKKMGAQIRVHSEVGKGSEFKLIFQLTPSLKEGAAA